MKKTPLSSGFSYPIQTKRSTYSFTNFNVTPSALTA